MERKQMGSIEAERRYTKIRMLSLDIAQQYFCKYYEEKANKRANGFVFGNIDDKAIGFWRENWKDHYDPFDYGWDWEALRFKYRTESRFEVAVWSNNSLGCLALGRFSHGKTNLKWKFLMGSPCAEQPLKGYARFAAMEAALAYATAVGSRWITIVQIKKELLHLYSVFGDVTENNNVYNIIVEVDNNFINRLPDEPSIQNAQVRLKNYNPLVDRMK
jgi:hypothetical protein